MPPGRGPATNAGSREVEPLYKSVSGSRKRKQSPADQRRRALRALARAMGTTAEIQGTSRQRQQRRSDGEANAAASLDTDLALLYDVLGDDKRVLFGTGLVPNGEPYRGRTWRAR